MNCPPCRRQPRTAGGFFVKNWKYCTLSNVTVYFCFVHTPVSCCICCNICHGVAMYSVEISHNKSNKKRQFCFFFICAEAAIIILQNAKEMSAGL